MDLTTDEEDETDSHKAPSLMDRLFQFFTWPGFKASQWCEHALNPHLIPFVFFPTMFLFWGAVIAVIGNGIAYLINGRI